MLTRREFGLMAVGSLALPRGIFGADSKIAGVQIGAQSYSFRALERPANGDMVSVVIAAMNEVGLNDCELYAPHVEPVSGAGRGASPEAQRAARESLRKWRVETPISHFQGVRKRFNSAGISIFGYNYSFRDDFTDEEIDRGFEMTKALGASVITASTTLPIAARVAPFAEKHKMMVAMHGHSNTKDPNEFATPESFAKAATLSKFFKVNLDIGHFTAANYDAVAYMKEHHANITNIHLKDRKKNQGDNTPWGEGDTPIREVLQLLKSERWPIRAHIEYEYPGAGSPIEETKKCYAFVRQALA
jgi:sugar phosphate isomerase/epimerase